VAIRWSVRKLPRPRAFILTAAHPMTVRLLGRGRKSYLLKDDYAAGAALIGVPRAVVERRRRELLRLVDAVAVVSPALANTAEGMGALSQAVVIPPGCEVTAGTDRRSSGSSTIPRAAFIGMVSDRLDFDVLDAVVAAGFNILIAGRQQPTFGKHSRLADLIGTGSVSILGELPERSVASFIEACDVTLLPYTNSDFNLASFPLKLLEYLAAGRPVVATALPAVRWLNAPHVYTVEGPGEVAAALAVALEDSRDPQTERRCREFAAQHTWADRAQEHLQLLARP
jgi:teichuronic acid biosynthesis glycosyltransferase TuaH